jgi:hypothetical protein
VGGLVKCLMERRFSMEAKSFSFSVIPGKSVFRLEEKRKGFGGFISLGIKGSVWLADTVEEALESQKEDFARSSQDEVRVRMGSNRAGCFLEAAIFVDGDRKGVIRLLEGRRGWGWRMFMDELCFLVAQLAAKDLPAVVNVGVDGSLPSDVDVIATPLGGMKSSCLETLVSELGRWLPMGGRACLMEVLRRLAMEFLAKMRAEVDRVIFFGLGLKIKASRDLRKKKARVFSRLGLKLKLSLEEDKKRQQSLVGIDVGSNLLGSIQIAPATNRMSPKVSLLSLEPIQFASVGVEVGSDLVGLAEIALESPETNRTSPDVPSTNLAALEVSHISLVTIDAGSVLMGSLKSCWRQS